MAKIGPGNRPPQEVSRRRFLKLAGAGALGLAVVGSGLKVLGGRTRAMESAPGAGPRLRQWSIVIDLRYCDGCQSQNKPPQCAQSCILGRFVPEPMEWLEVYEHNLPGGGTQFMPTLCMQCQNPPCVNVCPVGATWSTPEGVVLIDQKRCIGCRFCMAACPYERRFFLWGDPPRPPETALVSYDPVHQIGAPRGTVMKCDFCTEIAAAGRIPYCAEACPNKAIYWADLEEDLATNGQKVVKLSQFLSENQAYRYKEELGTKPRVYYIPGHGEAVGRSPFKKGRLPVEWPWSKTEGAKTWKRSGR